MSLDKFLTQKYFIKQIKVNNLKLEKLQVNENNFMQ